MHSTIVIFLAAICLVAGQRNYCLEEHNRVRREHGLAQFTSDPRLEAAAADHNDVMVSQNCFSHQCEGEPSFSERISRRGYQWRAAAENIAKGYSDCNAAVRGKTDDLVWFSGWMNSDGHRRNILSNNPNIGCAERDKYYTCKFATPR